MKEEIVYTVEREFLGKITPEELVRKMIQIHQEDEEVQKAV